MGTIINVYAVSQGGRCLPGISEVVLTKRRKCENKSKKEISPDFLNTVVSTDKFAVIKLPV